MKKIRYSIIISLAALAAGCAKTETGGVETQTVEPNFTLGTRGVISEDTPAHGDAFRLVAYTATGTTASYQAAYAYDANGDHGAAGDLIPVTVSTTAPYGTTLQDGTTIVKDRVSGLHMAANTTYRLAMLHPAVPMSNSGTGTLGSLARFEFSDTVYASLPDDASGDGDLTDDPFEIYNGANLTVHPVPSPIKLYPLQAEIQAYFYSTTGRTYTVNNVSLVDAGNNGWYNARTGIIYPNYNYTSKTSYSSSTILPANNLTANYKDVTADVTAQADQIPLKGGGTATSQWKLSGQPVFPTDYSGAVSQILQMTLAVRIDMGNDAYNNAMIPITLKIERNKRYTFYIDVQSAIMSIFYNVSDWGAGGQYDDDPIGSEVIPYGVVALTKNSGNWTPNDYDDDPIGGSI